MNLLKNLRLNYLLIFIISLVATLGSLYYSEVMYFMPCKLCWYQRIAMYPIVIYSLIGFVLKSKDILKGITVVSFIGWLIGIFHYSLQKNIFGIDQASCGDSLCATIWVNYYGFITIPFLAFTAFSLILIISISNFISNRKKKIFLNKQ